MMVGLVRAKSPFEGSRLISSPSYMSKEDILAWLMALAKSCFVIGFCNLDKITTRLHRLMWRRIAGHRHKSLCMMDESQIRLGILYGRQ